MTVDVLLGLQWGDEGKGKIVDYLAPKYDIIARFQGGPNAGHTLILGGEKFVLHTIPSGIFSEGLMNVIGNGVVIDPCTLEKEIALVASNNVNVNERLYVSRKAHLIMPTHKILDAAKEHSKGEKKIGSTLRGIGPTYMDKTGRNGLRVGDIEHPNFKKRYEALKQKHLNLLSIYDFEFNVEEEEKQWFDSIENLRKLNLIDSEYFINNHLKEGKKVLAEGAQGSMLDVDYGTYPFVTSSNTTTSGVCTGLGVPPSRIQKVYGITKAYCTRVGAGPFPTELHDAMGEKIRKAGGEFGATTGRPRRCGWIDLPALKYASMLNGVTELIVTKADVLNEFDSVSLCTKYKINGQETEQLPHSIKDNDITPVYKDFDGWSGDFNAIDDFTHIPANLFTYLRYIEDSMELPINIVSIGPGRNQIIVKDLQTA